MSTHQLGIGGHRDAAGESPIRTASISMPKKPTPGSVLPLSDSRALRWSARIRVATQMTDKASTPLA